MVNVLLTGSTGFIGRQLVAASQSLSGVQLTCAARYPVPLPCYQNVFVERIDSETDWSVALQAQRVVVHAAARAHVTNARTADLPIDYHGVNVDGTLNLARQSAEAGVNRFLFISSIGVNGKTSSRPFTEKDEANPQGLYAQSKWMAEQGLWEIQRDTGMEIVIVRPPLVYGANAPGNFGRLVSWVSKGIPLPLGATNNKRSLINVDNLVDLIITCITHPAAANQLFLASDGDDVSTSELLTAVAGALNKPSRLLPVPKPVLTFALSLLGKKELAGQLLGTLQIDNSKARELLGWKPPVSLEEGLIRCVV